MKLRNEGEEQDLGVLARRLRLALLVTDAALPLAGTSWSAPEDPEVPEETAPAVMDRSRLRGLAFTAVLDELARYDYKARPSDLAEMMDGRVPEASWPYETGDRT